MLETLRKPALALTIAGSTLLGVGCAEQTTAPEETDVAVVPVEQTVQVDATTVKKVEACVELYERKTVAKFGDGTERIALMSCVAMKSCFKDEKPSEVAAQVEQGSQTYESLAADIADEVDEVSDNLDLRRCVVQRVYGTEESGFFEKEEYQGMPPNLDDVTVQDFYAD